METNGKTTIKAAKPKHKGGRPKARIRRESHAKIRLTNTERFLFTAKAKEAGMSLSDFIRAAARSASVIARLTAEDIKIMRMITGLANNLNQLTRLAHKDGILTVVMQCGQVLTELHEALKYFNRHDRQDT
ncbi:plasmid mobilization relaxosome protein MobC [Mucilaginibacter robiniae]|uniref:Plasmid mobilization relaxosome protein MobC n=1 Tax=Mucilaginibacter robiniae TaxID=2728022 RepID=A0A7L5E3U9_9SPHI|nr:plasmid mobilization relaxosome protein MobC [Mucilaginibacter robiniae]QJD97701.1 plasmid mobilization relaxosome protein MobC [Mucilaginibacter robiniae]